MEPLITIYGDANNHQIEFTGQTKALVKTNTKTINLPLLITKVTTTPLMGFDCMKRLGVHLNADNSETQIHNVKLDDTKRNTFQLKKNSSIYSTITKRIKKYQ